MTGDSLSRVLIGESAPMRRLRADIVRIAASRVPVLIDGPTGVGKELVAESIHLMSGRSGRFAALNVCAVSDSLFESAIFGHLRGAFTGASIDVPGYLAEAHRGTLFLDEVSALSVSLQVKLLRALETGRYRPIGGREDRQSDFRIVAATNENLQALVAQGHFRADLLYRIGGCVLSIPPLRLRLEDVPLLVAHFLDAVIERRAEDGSRMYGDDAIARLQAHDWPGNVRELRHVVEVASVYARADEIIRARHIDEALAHWAGRPGNGCDYAARGAARRRLVDLLDRCGGNTELVAVELGVSRKTVYARMQRLGITPPRRSAIEPP